MDKATALKKIRTEFPRLKWKTAKHITEGMDHYVLLLDSKYIFRFPRHKQYAVALYDETVFLDYLIKLKLGIQIPKYNFVAKDKSFAGYQIIPGTQLTKKVFNSLSDSQKKLIAKQLSLFLSILHRVPIRTAKKYKVEVYKTPDHYKKLKGNINKYLLSRLSKPENELIKDYLKEFGQNVAYPTPCLVHLDLWSNHLILGKNKKLNGIIDFSDRSISDPAFDFAELWIYGRKFVEMVYKNYSGPKDKDFLHRSILLFKRVPLKMMLFPLMGFGGNFSKNHKYFREVFMSSLL